MDFFENRFIAYCTKCGCDDNHACMTNEGPCSWIEVDYLTAAGLCSACATPEEENKPVRGC